MTAPRVPVLLAATVVSVGLVAAACGETLMDEPLEAPRAPAPSAKPEPVRPVTSLLRADVDRTLSSGLGYFLQHVSVEPVLAEGRFQGFRIRELTPSDYFAGVDLRPGDIVTRVNGMPIERDIDAYDAFLSLRTAPALRVKLVRGGAERELVLPIIGAPRALPPDAGR